MNEYPLEIECFHLIYECIEKQMIFINFIDFKVHSHVQRDVDLAILQALLNGNPKLTENSLKKSFSLATNSTEINFEQKYEQLNLALEWNRVDIVKTFIMKDDRDWNVSQRQSSLKIKFVFFVENQFNGFIF